jgi:hypothetical protein
MTGPRQRKNAITLPIPQAADLAALLTTIDEFLRSAHADGALAAFLASRGTQFPGHDASILTDELSFTALSFRSLLAAAGDCHQGTHDHARTV